MVAKSKEYRIIEEMTDGKRYTKTHTHSARHSVALGVFRGFCRRWFYPITKNHRKVELYRDDTLIAMITRGND